MRGIDEKDYVCFTLNKEAAQEKIQVPEVVSL